MIFTQWLFVAVVVALSVTSQVAGHGGGRWGSGWGGWWGWDTDTTDACVGCNEYCNITASGAVKGGCVCPGGFTCTVSHTQTRYSWRHWRRYSEEVTYSVCERDEEEPEHMGPPCLVTKGEEFYNISCAEGFACSVGPVEIVTGYELTFCNYATKDDVDTEPWWDWFCESDTYAWKHWCERDTWFGDGYNWFPWWHCYKW